MTTTLPTTVIEKDRKLQRSADELMELRWHWTLDETNPERVSQREYARQVGVDQSKINVDANAWADYLAAQSDAQQGITPGAPQSPGDYRTLRKMSGERQRATKAVAKATGKAVSTLATHDRGEVDAVLNTARERAVDRGTTVDHEFERAAEWRAKTRKAAEREKDEHKARSTARFIEIEGDLGAAMQRLRNVLNAAEDVPFSDDERELLTASLGKLRALLNLIDLRIAGETKIDWDDEFQKIVG
jgi:hypothetical protein